MCGVAVHASGYWWWWLCSAYLLVSGANLRQILPRGASVSASKPRRHKQHWPVLEQIDVRPNCRPIFDSKPNERNAVSVGGGGGSGGDWRAGLTAHSDQGQLSTGCVWLWLWLWLRLRPLPLYKGALPRRRVVLSLAGLVEVQIARSGSQEISSKQTQRR